MLIIVKTLIISEQNCYNVHIQMIKRIFRGKNRSKTNKIIQRGFNFRITFKTIYFHLNGGSQKSFKLNGRENTKWALEKISKLFVTILQYQDEM